MLYINLGSADFFGVNLFTADVCTDKVYDTSSTGFWRDTDAVCILDDAWNR